MKKNQSPRLGFWLLSRFLEKEGHMPLVGDLEEMFLEQVQMNGWLMASLWYWGQITKMILPLLKHRFILSLNLFVNYFKIASRNVFEYKTFSIINVMGLAVGMSVCILIMLWVQHEFSFDRFHKNGEDIFIVGNDVLYDGQSVKKGGTPPMLGPALKSQFPDIVDYVRFGSGYASVILQHGNKTYHEMVKGADPSVLTMFSLPLILGNPETALADPYSIVLSRRMARKYFGEENPIGKIITVENEYDLMVTGILENIPENSTIQFDFIVPLLFIYDNLWGKGELHSWSNFAFNTFVQLKKGASTDILNRKISDILKKNDHNNVAEPFLAPFSRLHLYGLSSGGGNILQVRIFSVIAIFILIIACINFMNLTVAFSDHRGKEVGMRKVVGALRRDIMKQFYCESLIFSFISLVLSMIVVTIFLPAFNQIAGKHLSLNIFGNFHLLGVIIGIVFVTGVVSGSYPALFISSFKPANIFKDSIGFGSRGSGLRKILIIGQFSLSIVLMICTIIVFKQIDFMRNKDLGFTKENLIYIELNQKIKTLGEQVGSEILKSPAVSNVSFTSFTPMGFFSSDSGWNWQGKSPDVIPDVRRFCTDYDFLKTFRVSMAEGEFYSPENTRDILSTSKNIVINKVFAKMIGKQNILNSELTLDSNRYRIIGVVEDFNFFSLYYEIGPLAIFFKTDNPDKSLSRYRYVFIKYVPEKSREVLDHIKILFKKYSPEYPFHYGFLDDGINRMYVNEDQMAILVRYFAVVAMMISCFGLFGLSTFLIHYRLKEIGIRKVLGATIPHIHFLLTKEFAKLVVAANIVAWPVSFLLTNQWLENFAFRIPLDIGNFVLAALISLGIALATVGYQSQKAAMTNPVNVMKQQ